ncbi:hypothetical protein U1Q18_021992 [Sarracenia purpurea var. burkii]
MADDWSFRKHGFEAKSDSPTLNTSFGDVSLQPAGEDGLHPSLDEAPNAPVPRARACWVVKLPLAPDLSSAAELSQGAFRVRLEPSSATPLRSNLHQRWKLSRRRR